MNRYLALIVAVVALGWASTAQAQAYTVYYPAQPAPVTTYYAPAPTTAYYAPAPTTTYYAPAPQVTYYAQPVTYYRPILGGALTGWRYNPAPVSYYRYPARTAYYYPAY